MPAALTRADAYVASAQSLIAIAIFVMETCEGDDLKRLSGALETLLAIIGERLERASTSLQSIPNMPVQSAN